MSGFIKGVPKEIALRQIGHFSKADKAYGEGAIQRLGLDASASVATE